MKLSSWRYLTIVTIAIMSFAMWTGCGKSTPPTFPVVGKVVYSDGKPFAGGYIELCPLGGEYRATARGEIQQDGSFELSTFSKNDGAIEGDHAVLVIPPIPERQSGQPLPRDVEQSIDPRFGQFGTSGLRITVASDPTKNEVVLRVGRPGK